MAQIATYLFPVLWSLWILSAIFRRPGTPVNTVLLRWLFIDLLLLAVLFAIWCIDHGWFQEVGSDTAGLIMIAPLHFPVAAAVHNVSEDLYAVTFGKLLVLEKIMQNIGLGDVVTNWLLATIAVLPGTFIVVLLSQLIQRLRMGKAPKRKPI